jgi:hypothetical protein
MIKGKNERIKINKFWMMKTRKPKCKNRKTFKITKAFDRNFAPQGFSYFISATALMSVSH